MTRWFLFFEAICITLLFFVATDAWAVRITSLALICLVVCTIGLIYGHPTLVKPKLGYNVVFAVMLDVACIISAINIFFECLNGRMAIIGKPMEVFAALVILGTFAIYGHFNEWLLRQAYHLLKSETQISAIPEAVIPKSELEEDGPEDVRIDMCEMVNDEMEKSSKAKLFKKINMCF
uniref:Uncharacterized protein n=1 Tax=Ditylenchus dipsaci TaxID=166011 RepID=A0A915EQ54_9BILA